jgi:mono/diheme cytochrome c family protein
MTMKRLIPLGIAIIAATALTAGAADAKENYEKACAKCHGADGKGQTKMGQKLGAKDYTDAKVQAELKDDVAMLPEANAAMTS